MSRNISSGEDTYLVLIMNLVLVFELYVNSSLFLPFSL